MGLQYNQIERFTWGLECLDRRFGKPSVRELIVMFGYSGIGKTEFTFFTARKNAEEGNKVIYFSLELPEYDMKQRICLSKAKVSKYEFQMGKFTEEQRNIMDRTWDDLSSIENLTIVGSEDKSINYLIRQMRLGYDAGYRMFVIDNLDKITDPTVGENDNTRYQSITSKLQDLKNELSICILLIHHAKKTENKQASSSPAGLAGMRGNQKIIDNSTQVIEVFRDLDPDDPDVHNITEIHQLKDTQGGPKGYHKLVFEKGAYLEYVSPDKKTKELSHKPF